MSYPRWPAVSSHEYYDESAEEFVCELRSSTKSSKNLETVGRGRSKSGALNSARRAMRRAIKSQETADLNKAIRDVKGRKRT